MRHCRELDSKVRKCLTLRVLCITRNEGKFRFPGFSIYSVSQFQISRYLSTSLIDRGDKAINAYPLIARENGVQRKVIASLANFTSTVRTQVRL